MCGLVFVGGKTSLSMSDMNIFEQFLQCDTYRGDHSTGVCAIFKPYNGEGFVKMGKAAVDGFDFVKTQLFEDITRHKATSSVGSAYATYPKAAFGHNRYATIGAVNAENAHPFNVGHITLAHNGTLNTGWKSKLPNGHEFTVDSHCVANAMAVLGVDKLIQLLDGAFTLIWHNSEDKTLNIIRNKERPFHLWETTMGDWFGCSEEKMGDWLLTRGKVPRKFKRHFELEVGVQYVFDVSEGCVLKEERKHELPVFPTYSYYSSHQGTTQTAGSYGHLGPDDLDDDDALNAWWDERITQRSSRSVSPSQTQTQGQKEQTGPSSTAGARAKLNYDLQQAGLDVVHGDFIEFEMYEYKEYPKRPGFGYVRGYVPELPEFIEVHVHDVKEEAFQMEARGYVQIISGYVSKHVLTIIGKSVNNRMDKPQHLPLLIEHHDDKEVVDEQDFSFLDQIADDDLPVESRTMMSGERFTEREWNRSHHNVCSMCSDPIHFEEMEVATIENGYCFCGDCVAATNQRAEDISREKELAQAESDKEKARREELVSATHEEPKLVGRESYCVACGGYHGDHVISGEMTHANWTSLATTCYWKLIHKEKFTGQGKRPILSLKKNKTEAKHTCTSCATDFPLEMMSTEQEDLCSDCYTRFHQATTVRTSFNEELVEKVVGVGMRVTPVLWAKMNGCRQCGTSIPYTIADKVEFWGSAPICPDCTDRLNNSEI